MKLSAAQTCLGGFICLGACWVLLAGPLHAQDAIGTPASKIERKNKAPVSREILRVKLPKPIEAKLSNGLTVLILEDHRRHLSPCSSTSTAPARFSNREIRPDWRTLQRKCCVKEHPRGAAFKLPSRSTVSGPRLAPTRRSARPSSAERLGLSHNFDEWFAVTADVLLRPSFPAEELEKLKQRQRRSYASNAQRRVFF
jgi:hypothetical protein